MFLYGYISTAATDGHMNADGSISGARSPATFQKKHSSAFSVQTGVDSKKEM